MLLVHLCSLQAVAEAELTMVAPQVLADTAEVDREAQALAGQLLQARLLLAVAVEVAATPMRQTHPQDQVVQAL